MNITVTLTADNKLMQLLGALLAPAAVQSTKKEQPAKEKADEGTIARPTEAPSAEPDSGITLEMLRKKVAPLSKANKKEKVFALLKEFYADNLTVLDPKHYAAFLKKAEEL